MPKRLPPGERAYRPVAETLEREKRDSDAFPDRELIQSVITRKRPTGPSAADEGATAEARPQTENVVELPKRGDAPESETGQGRARPTTKGFETHSTHMRFKVLHSERDDILALIQRQGVALRTTLTFSHLHRVWHIILKHAEPQIGRALQPLSLKRPPNEDPVALAEYEHQLAHHILEALRKAPPLIR